MTLTAPQQTELEKPVTRVAYFVEFQFLSATVYLSSLQSTVTWGGHDWIGLGLVGGITPIDNQLGTASQSLTFQLNMAASSLFDIGVTACEEYRGRDAKLYFCPLDDQFRLVDTPVICWRGSMDTIISEVSGKAGESTGKMSLKCETSSYGLKRMSNLRMNAAQQKQRHPNDTGFDYLTDLIATPGSWLSIKFQQQ
jgi:hypothetical protein